MCIKRQVNIFSTIGSDEVEIITSHNCLIFAPMNLDGTIGPHATATLVGFKEDIDSVLQELDTCMNTAG